MISNLLNRSSNWNAQFFREVKGRLKPRTVGLTVIVSVLIQALISLYFWMIIPGKGTVYSNYCVQTTKPDNYQRCLLDAAGYPKIDWLVWWNHFFLTLTWLMPFVLLVAGVYMIIGDLAKEERRGTLNFIRLSPQTSSNILIGKLMGVPLIPWLAVAAAIPLHLLTAAKATIPLFDVVSIYLVTIAACCFFYTAAAFYAFMGGAHGWLGAIVIWGSYSIFFQMWQASRSYESGNYFFFNEWYGIKIGNNLAMFVGFSLVCLAIATFWNWLAINRRFRNPNNVLLSKRQSYGMTLSYELFIFGFVFHTYPDWVYKGDGLSYITGLLAYLMVMNLMWFVLMIAALTPHRQTLLDWARYRKDGSTKTPKSQWQRTLLKDLVWGDKSPATLAIALNLLIPIILFTPWIATWDSSTPRAKLIGFCCLVISALYLLVCALLTQSLLFGKSKRRALVALLVMGAIISLPPIFMAMIGSYPSQKTALLWLFSAFPFAAIEHLTFSPIVISLVVYMLTFTVLAARQTRQLKKAGESELKALMAHRSH